MGKGLEDMVWFTKEDLQMAIKCVKRCSTLLAIKTTRLLQTY